jgi:PEP-CTERM motif
LLAPGSVTLSMNLSSVSNGAGFSLPPGNGTIAPFVADASVNIGADQVPEPASAMLLMFGLVAAAGVAKRARR